MIRLGFAFNACKRCFCKVILRGKRKHLTRPRMGHQMQRQLSWAATRFGPEACCSSGRRGYLCTPTRLQGCGFRVPVRRLCIQGPFLAWAGHNMHCTSPVRRWIPGLWRNGVELIPAFVHQVPSTITILWKSERRVQSVGKVALNGITTGGLFWHKLR